MSDRNGNGHADMMPPANIEAERGVLGSMLLENETIPAVASILDPGDFFRDTHAIVFRSIVDLQSRGNAADAITLIEDLRLRGSLDRIGGEDEIAALLKEVPHAANAVYYARIVRQKAVGRRIVQSAKASILDACSNTYTADELAERVADRSREIHDLAYPDDLLLGTISRISKTQGQSSDSFANSADYANLKQWDAPVTAVTEAEPFPLDVLPVPLADLCRKASAAIQCPVDYLGVAALGLAGGVIGLSVNLSIDNSWIESPNLYVAIVGPPGTKKTPAIRLLARPLYEIDSRLRETYKLDAAAHHEDVKQYEKARRRDDGGPPPIPPVHGHLTLDDATQESIGPALAENPRGLILLPDELTGWVASLNAYRQGKGADKQFYMKCNSGVFVKVTRRGSKEPIVVPRPCLSIVGGLTPGTMTSIKDGRADDGWLDRILFSYPEPLAELPRWSRPQVPAELRDDWDQAIRKLWDRPMVSEEGRKRPYYVHLTADAEIAFERWFNETHRSEQASPDFPRQALAGPWSKIEGFSFRLALILSLLHQAYDPTDDGPPRDVDALDAWGATRLASYFKAHFRRAKAELSRGNLDTPDLARAILGWIQREEILSFSGRDVSRRYHYYTDRDQADALGWLVARRFLRRRPDPPRPSGQPGRVRRETYDVSPHLYLAKSAE